MVDLKAYLQSHSKEELHPSELANLLKDLSDKDFAEALQLIPKELIAIVALELPDRYFDDIVESIDSKELALSLTELESDDQTDFIQELEERDKTKAQEVFNSLDLDDQEDILELKKYDDEQAGAYMQKELFVAKLEDKVSTVIEEFKKLKLSDEIENVHNLFVQDDKNKLSNVIGLEDLLIFDFNKTIYENIKENLEKYTPIFAYDDEDIDEVVQKFKEYDLNTLAIVNRAGILIGRITSDDIYDIINEQATDQMYNLAGVDDEAEEDDDLLKAGKSRAVWLGINLITAVLASIVIGFFESTLQSIVALAILMPIVASMGGNAGTQSLTVVVRQLALGDIAKHDALRTIKKEVVLSLVNGLLFALVIGIIAAIWFHQNRLGIVIALSMVINLLSAGFFGSVIPLMLKKFNIDPAIGSTVILTTITDVVGFLSFLGLATMMLL